MSAAGLEVRNLRVSARGRRGEVSIVSDVELTVRRGEAVGIVGESGSGKSLTGRAIMDLLPPNVSTTGEISYGGLDLSAMSAKDRARLRGPEMVLIMQDPFTMLNPLERCGDQIVEALVDARGRRLGKNDAAREAVARLREVGIEDPGVAGQYPFELSGGMRQRVGIASALAERPGLVIADEPTTALDVTTQAEILDLLSALRVSHQMGLVLITHNLRVAFSICDRVYVMYAGTIVESAPVPRLVGSPKHPYSFGLLMADPPVEKRVADLIGVPGSVPAPGERPPGCIFAPRCAWKTSDCEQTVPALRQVGPDHASRCLRIADIEAELTRRRAEAEAAPDAKCPVAGNDGGPLLDIEKVRKVFRSRTRHGRETVALNDVSLRVAPGESVGLVGESGSGKTTLGRIIVQLEHAASGSVKVGGVELAPAHPGRAAAAAARDVVQMVFQDPYSSLNPGRTVNATLREALALGHKHYDREKDVGRLLQQVGLPASVALQRPTELSGGERQRVAIARALARDPRLLVCDEVSSALDVSVQAQILSVIRRLREEMGVACLFISHDLAVIRQVTERVYVLREGVVVEEGPTADILDRPQHPYTQRLIASIPGVGDATAQRIPTQPRRD